MMVSKIDKYQREFDLNLSQQTVDLSDGVYIISEYQPDKSISIGGLFFKGIEEYNIQQT